MLRSEGRVQEAVQSDVTVAAVEIDFYLITGTALLHRLKSSIFCKVLQLFFHVKELSLILYLTALDINIRNIENISNLCFYFLCLLLIFAIYYSKSYKQVLHLFCFAS